MNTIDYAKKQMQEKELSFLVLKNEPLLEETTYHPKVILNSLRENKHIFSGALVATLVLGRAGALLLAYGGVKEVYADIISIPAVECLRSNSVKVTFSELRDNLSDLPETDAADLEQKCLDIASPFQAYELMDQMIPR